MEEIIKLFCNFGWNSKPRKINASHSYQLKECFGCFLENFMWLWKCLTKIENEGLVIYLEKGLVPVELVGPNWIKCSFKNTLRKMKRGKIKLTIALTELAIATVWSLSGTWLMFPLQNNIKTCKKLVTTVSARKHWTGPFVRWKQISTSDSAEHRGYIAVILKHSCLPVFTSRSIVLRFFLYRNNWCEFLTSDGVNLQSHHQPLFRSPVCGASLFHLFAVVAFPTRRESFSSTILLHRRNVCTPVSFVF